MSKVICKAISSKQGIINRGKATIEWYEDGKPQYYCRGYYDTSTEEPIKVCKDCIDFVNGLQIEIDFKKFQEKNKAMEVQQ